MTIGYGKIKALPKRLRVAYYQAVSSQQLERRKVIMTSSDFTLELALSLFESKEQFPIDMWEAGEWLGYSRKDSIKRSFVNCKFIEGVEFVVHKSVDRNADGTFSQFLEVVKISLECFKDWGMMAGTEKGKEVRKYFKECEKRFRELEAEKKKEQQDVKAFIQQHARVYKPEFQKEFYDQLYRVTGYLRPKRGNNPYTAVLIHEYVYKMFGQDILDEIERVNPVIGYYTYEIAKASPEEMKKLKGFIGGQKSAVTMYTKSGKLAKAKKAQKKVDQLIAKLKRWEKPHTLKLPKRKHLNHQFCSDLIGLPSLQSHLQSMVHIMRTLPSDDPERFAEAMNAAFQGEAIKGVKFLILDVPDWKALG